jgi:hypothetical protein
MYKIVPQPFGNQIVVKRLSDNAFISEGNSSDYQAYLEWLAEGNTPEPPDQPE